MRRRLARRSGRVGFRFPQALAQTGDLACQRVDLMPLRGDGLVQRLDGRLLKHQLGLERIDPLNVAFDPTVHEAVAHEPGDGVGQPEVVEVMRAGYRWKGRVLRPAMVKVRG